MKKLLKICATAILVSAFFLTMAVVIKSTTTPFTSEPVIMALIGISLIRLTGLARKKL